MHCVEHPHPHDIPFQILINKFQTFIFINDLRWDSCEKFALIESFWNCFSQHVTCVCVGVYVLCVPVWNLNDNNNERTTKYMFSISFDVQFNFTSFQQKPDKFDYINFLDENIWETTFSTFNSMVSVQKCSNSVFWLKDKNIAQKKYWMYTRHSIESIHSMQCNNLIQLYSSSSFQHSFRCNRFKHFIIHFNRI